MSTLYINGREVEAHLDERRLVMNWMDFVKDDVPELLAPLHELDRVVVIGTPKITMAALQALAFKGIPVYFLTEHGRWVGSLEPNTNGNALRRLKQYQVAQDEALQLMIAQTIAYAKIRNMRRVLQRLAANREQAQAPEQIAVVNSLAIFMERTGSAKDVDVLRGIEGMATADYFRRLAAFFPPELPFLSRNRRPPRDEANALLSWSYTIVAAEIEAQIRCAGLDPCFSFLHELSTGRPSLVFDIIEPLRAPLCDLLALNLLNHKLLQKEHFEHNPDDGGVYLKRDARKIFFCEYEQYMERRFAESKGGEHVTFRRVIYKMVYAILNAIETRNPPHLFLMP